MEQKGKGNYPTPVSQSPETLTLPSDFQQLLAPTPLTQSLLQDSCPFPHFGGPQPPPLSSRTLCWPSPFFFPPSCLPHFPRVPCVLATLIQVPPASTSLPPLILMNHVPARRVVCWPCWAKPFDPSAVQGFLNWGLPRSCNQFLWRQPGEFPISAFLLGAGTGGLLAIGEYRAEVRGGAHLSTFG